MVLIFIIYVWSRVLEKNWFNNNSKYIQLLFRIIENYIEYILWVSQQFIFCSDYLTKLILCSYGFEKLLQRPSTAV